MRKLPQSSAIPYRVRDGRTEFLLITSLKGNWIFPKGIVEPGESPEETALKEAREEAGICGRLHALPIGSYTHVKWETLCEVVVFLLEVELEDDSWPEQQERRRAWFGIDEAQKAIKSRKLGEMLDLARAALNR